MDQLQCIQGEVTEHIQVVQIVKDIQTVAQTVGSNYTGQLVACLWKNMDQLGASDEKKKKLGE